MARYWVGGTGTWTSTDTTHWSASSGGSGGASVPFYDDVIFDSNSFSAPGQIVTLADNPGYFKENSFDASGALYNPTFTNDGVNNLQIDTAGVINLGATTWICTGMGSFYFNVSWDIFGAEPLTLSASEATLIHDSILSFQISTGSNTSSGNIGSLEIRSSASSFYVNPGIVVNLLTLDAGATLWLGIGTTTNIDNLVANGTPTSHIIIKNGSGSAQQSTLNVTGTVNISYTDVKNNFAQGNIPFDDTEGGVDNGGNTNWSFPSSVVFVPQVVIF